MLHVVAFDRFVGNVIIMQFYLEGTNALDVDRICMNQRIGQILSFSRNGLREKETERCKESDTESHGEHRRGTESEPMSF